MKRITISLLMAAAAWAVKYYIFPTGDPYTELAEQLMAGVVGIVFFVLVMAMVPKKQ